MRKLLLLILFVQVFQACKVADKIPPQKRLYGGAEVKVVKHDSLKGGEVPEFKTILEDATRPSPNTMLFGYPYKVAFNYWLGPKKKDKGFKEWFRKRLGEEPVFIDSYLVDQNVLNLQSILHSYGYFDGRVSGDLEEKNVLGFAKYQVEPNERYQIDSVIIDPPSEGDFNEDFLSFSQHFKFPKYFDLQKIKEERQEMYNSMRNMGYYYFRPEYINIQIDSNRAGTRLSAKVAPREHIPTTAKKRYQINNIYVNIDKPTVINRRDSSSFDFFRGLILDDPNKKYKEKIFLDAIAFRPGVLYNNDAVSVTSNRLLSLGNFRSIQSQFTVVNRLDSTLIDVYYNLQTNKKKTINFETNALSRSSGLAGTQVSLSWKNINTFKGAERIEVGVNGNFEFQLGGKRVDTEYNENYRTGAWTTLQFPRFIAPWIKIDPENSKVLPRTLLRISYENFIKRGLYDLNSASAEWGYAWTRGRGIEHAFKPFKFTFVKSSNLTPAFVEEIFLNPQLLEILNNNLIIGSGYEIVITPTSRKKSTFSYRGGVDAAGTLLTLFDKLKKDESKRGEFFGELYSQFVRVENEVRYRYELSRDVSWANRAIVGIGAPYGNSYTLPFVNQFFVGGNNSLRAFRARGVGPGTYTTEGKSNAEKFVATNTGDIKIEFNTELRYKLNSLFSTAFFVDAGNIWMFKDPYIYDEGAVFSKNFMKELAVGGGIGFRLDFGIFVFRIDVATPFRKPWLEESNRWVFDQMSLKSKEWRRENIIWNFAVGLPF
ncbi:surface antigen (D15) [Leadbetterella byssophila DSM 17132]|uniref:Surface antigen (D15) n=1 Tax=Leadbetterella byssophila (strain DSM 17132 / JCM 16389 / KACC 11308 / NBRC 106382 / 4M15) TaxID=649349 RepID=E4RVR0_LEAB4|nr:BamA/TamA family outer membrane protein [Leadbetterella byssophila]ADQ17959.1 surface antigen (D15) [Leadbetterella byssophila DSM 17132]